MTIPYDPFNWYWVVAGSSTQVYSSAADNYVLVSDTTYTAWLAAGGTPTPIASEAELGAVLAQTFQAPTPAGILTGYNNALAIFTKTPALSVQANTASSSTSTGALVVVGGVGVGGALNVGGTLIAGNIPASGGGTTNFLRADGTWAAPPAGGAGQALTKTDDTNVTLTLGGSPTVALVTAASLTLGWTGTLSNARGGTGTGTYALGDTLYSSATNVLSKLAGNTTATKNFLSQTGTGTVSAAPAWGTIATTDLTGSAALTAVNDTNVTLTLGGTPATALLRAASVTAGWTGTLAVSRGGSGAGTFTANGILYGSGTSAFGVTAQGAAGQLLLGQGAAAPAWATMGSDATITSAGALTIANSAVTFAKMQNSAAAGLSVIGRSANTAGVFAEISAASDAQVFRRSGTAVGFGAIDISSANAVVNRLAYANVVAPTAASRLLGRGTTTGDWQECTLGGTLAFTTTALGVATSANFSWSGTHAFTSGTASTSPSTGTIVVTGGVGVSGSVRVTVDTGDFGVGGNALLYTGSGAVFTYLSSPATVAGTIVLGNSVSNQSFYRNVNHLFQDVAGANTYFSIATASNFVQVNANTASTSTTTGGLQTLGGVGVALAIYAGGLVAARANLATPAAASAVAAFTMGSAAVGIYWGTGAPSFTAPKGSLYICTDASAANTRLYINNNGSTGWAAVTSA